MSKQDVWMPLYIGDYLRDTMGLSTREHGIYLLLILHYWVEKQLTDDMEELMYITKIEEQHRPLLEKILKKYFTHETDRFLYKRIDEELRRAKNISNRNRENGRKGGRPKKHTGKNPKLTQTKPKANPNKTQTETQTEPKRNPKKTQSQSQCKIDIDTSVSISSADPAPQKEDRSVYHLIETAFLSKNQDFNYGREGRHLVELEKKALARQDPEGFIKKVICVFWELTHSNDKLFKDQPFLPSILNSSGLWPRVMKRIEQMDEQGAEMDPELEQFIDTLFLEKVK